MVNYKLWLGIAIIIIVVLISTTFHFAGVINILETFTNIWSWIVTVLLAVAFTLIYQGIKEKPKKQTNEIKKDDILYGVNVGDVKNNIHHFNKQSGLPPFERVLECAKQKIEILAWTGEDITTQHIDAIKNAIYRNIQVTIMLLAPDSEVAKNSNITYDTIDLPQRVQKSLRILCDERNKLGDKKQFLVIKKHYVDNNRSMIILDSTSNDAWIQVTSYVKGVDASSRYSESAYKKENEDFFNRHYEDYRSILNKLKEHKCNNNQQE